MAHNLVTDPVIDIIDGGKTSLVTLPGLLERFGPGGSVTLSGIRPHQAPVMHMFLVQLAVESVLRVGGDASNWQADEPTWRRRLEAVAPLYAWDLVNEDPSQPAFLQPPVPQEDVKGFSLERHPDDLTTLVLSKNHSVKQSVMAEPSPWLWAVALIELQTSGSFSGRDHYGIVRMNGGCGSRPMVSIFPDMAEAEKWRRDVTALLERLPALEQGASMFAAPGGGLAATWLEPWDGKTELAMDGLSPLCIEVCRRIRLSIREGRIVAFEGTSRCRRIGGSKELKGRLGDPWCPISTGDDGKSLTISGGWDIRLQVDLVVGGEVWQPSLLQAPRPSEKGTLFLHAACLSGGQGKTDGYHEITVPIPAKVGARLFHDPSGRDRIAEHAKVMLQDGNEVASCLKTAILCMSQGGVDLDVLQRKNRREADQPLAKFERRFEDDFFPLLWRALDGADPRSVWLEWLIKEAGRSYGQAVAEVPVRTEVRWKAEVRGRGVLFGLLKKRFPAQFDARQGNSEEEK